MNISAFALGKLNDQMKLYACRIISALEDFLSASDLQDLLEAMDAKESSAEQPKAASQDQPASRDHRSPYAKHEPIPEGYKSRHVARQPRFGSP